MDNATIDLDSWDRERVRDILIAKFGLKFPDPPVNTDLLAND